MEMTGLVFSKTRWQRQLENLEVANAAFLESDKLTPTLVATALAWKSTSQALYKEVRESRFLSLPTK